MYVKFMMEKHVQETLHRSEMTGVKTHRQSFARKAAYIFDSISQRRLLVSLTLKVPPRTK